MTPADARELVGSDAVDAALIALGRAQGRDTDAASRHAAPRPAQPRPQPYTPRHAAPDHATDPRGDR